MCVYDVILIIYWLIIGVIIGIKINIIIMNDMIFVIVFLVN